MVRIADARAGEFPDLLRRALDQADQNSNKVQAVLAQWAETDPEGLLEFAVANGTLQISEDGRSYDFSNFLCDALMAKDPSSAMRAADRFASAGVARKMRWYTVGKIAESSPELAAELMLEFNEGFVGGGIPPIPNVAEVATHLAAAPSLPPALERPMRSFFSNLMVSDVSVALEIWRQMPAESAARTLSGLISDGPLRPGIPIWQEVYEEAMQQVEVSELDPRHVITAFSAYLAAEGLDTAVEWIEKNTHGATRQQALGKVFEARMASHPDEVIREYEKLPPGPLRTNLATTIAVGLAKVDRQAGFAFAAKLPHDQTGRRAWGKLAASLNRRLRPSEFAGSVSGLPDHPGTSEFVRVTSRFYTMHNPKKALEWATTALEGDHRRVAIGQVVNGWVESDTTTALQHISGMQAGQERDLAFRSGVEHLINTVGTGASRWLSTQEGADRLMAQEILARMEHEDPRRQALFSTLRQSLE